MRRFAPHDVPDDAPGFAHVLLGGETDVRPVLLLGDPDDPDDASLFHDIAEAGVGFVFEPHARTGAVYAIVFETDAAEKGGASGLAGEAG